jgi:hypothetical protein
VGLLKHSSDAVMQIKSNTNDAAENVVQLKDIFNAKLEEDERVTIRRWLHPDGVDSESSFKSALNLRHPSTGTWLLDSNSFQAWLKSNNACIWLYGIRKIQHVRSAYIC